MSRIKEASLLVTQIKVDSYPYFDFFFSHASRASHAKQEY